MNYLTRSIRILVLLLSCITLIIGHAQVQDNFTDGDFANNPTWAGENTKFEAVAGFLHLNAPTVAESSYLSTPSSAIHNGTWEFVVQMGFATSSTSLTRVYLVSDQADLKQSLNGYFVMIGNTADEVSLYRQTGTAITKIIDGLDARVGAATVLVKVKVTRDATGLWALFTDVGNLGSYAQESTSVTDLTHTVSSYFGVYCLYTQTRSTLFWFDDIAVAGTTVPDLTPPTVTGVQVVNQSNVLINFNESLDPISSQASANFMVNKEIGNPANAVIQPDSKSVILTLTVPLTNGLTYSVQISGVQDTDGNTMTPATLEFLFFIPQPVNKKDIIVSEFMADPSPVIGLPEAEFVELFNRSANPIDLQNWKLSDGPTSATLPHYILMPGTQCIIVPTSAAVLFLGAISVANFPSLNNTGDNIIIKNSAGITVDSITYTQVWYHSDEKQDGGWSLEVIDPENICEEEGNWTASENGQGGTPGSPNSVLANNPDLTGPLVESVFVNNSNTLEIFFNEKLDGNELVNATSVPLLNFSSIVYSSSLRKLMITTPTSFQGSMPYLLTLSNVYDCSGNALENKTVQFVLPEVAEQGDLLINEILFNPKTGGVDFIEVYNNSNKHISFKKWSLANMNADIPINLKELEVNFVIAPKSFQVFTADPAILKAHYPRTIGDVCVTTTLPSMPDDEGSTALVDSLGKTIDFFFYADAFHVPFLKDKEGVSLERISLTSATNNANNWRSASQAENFATPGYRNSASSDGSASPEGDVLVEPEIFSPQASPQDFTKISYRFNQSGYVANATILDQQGRAIKVLANNEVLGTEGFFRWDGDRDDGGRARAGYYVAWVEVFNASGLVNTFRKRVLIAFR